ncbi:dicarboxylate/amino acid:cation symporter [Legionella sp. km772]|uniref:dicarboxylate/amino acid:cation symporter n=1 Tax=Legionella sp. km772 TaxID=2498111 RepID=UPI000F8EED07|nr:dicarboxylate/amino acid:cation symporter [Legionella sp. km772]RUR09733.1 dicarboxylate/amino acid:cation symporter [Legionella sp. km772]
MISCKTFKPYLFSLILLTSILTGGLAGFLLGPQSQYLKPLGDIFINLIFSTIVPLIFFSISSAIARTGSIGKLGKIMSYMSLVFLVTGLVAALYSLWIVLLCPPAKGVQLALSLPPQNAHINIAEQIVGMFTVSDFSHLLSHQHMLALIVFSILIGLAATQITQEKSTLILRILEACETLFMRLFDLIMFFAPIGFFAYFAVLVSELGPQVMGNYLRVTVLYYCSAGLYFIIASTLFAFIAAKQKGVRLFWANVLIPMLTSLATCSSAASIPANLAATKKMNVPPEIADTTIPLGSLIHKDGSVIGGMFKIAFIFGLFHLDFSSPAVLLTALGVSVLVGTVMGAIPSGGMLGELLILSVYGFPPSVLIAIAAISIIIDPLATMLNVTGNSVSSMLIARFVNGKDWYQPAKAMTNEL